MSVNTDDLRIDSITELLEPEALIREIPPTEQAQRTVNDARAAIHNILSGSDDRLLAVVGPCSIHDTKGGPRLRHSASRQQPMRFSLRFAS